MKEQQKAQKRWEEQVFEMLLALARAFHDPIRPNIRTQGIEERDLAFEAGLLIPAEVEMTIYSSQKRNRVLRLLEDMKSRGWVEMEPTPPTGAYHVFLKPQGEEYVRELLRPWWNRVWSWLRARRQSSGEEQGTP